jgi:hypothetical protein
VLVGWSGGDPAKPYALAPDAATATQELVLAVLQNLFLGDKAGAQPLANGIYRTAEDAYFTAVNAAIAALGAGLMTLGYSGAGTAVGAVATAATTFNGAAATYLTTKTRAT